ncbi:unnamed protein product, partial [Meganyctiphanes norvegica]
MAVMEGPLSKWTNVMKGWQYRWFVLDDSAGLLSYYTSKEKMVRGARRGCVRLKGAIVGIDDDDDSTFTITVDAKTFHFQAHDPDEREKWIRALEETILRHAPSIRRWDPSKPAPTMADFDKKLTESDAYLQLMIDQTSSLEKYIAVTEDPTDKARCQEVLTKANILLESVKHSIVLLQIAKNTAFPVNGVYHPCNAIPEGVSPGSSSIDGTSRSTNDTSDPLSPVQVGIEIGRDMIEAGLAARRGNSLSKKCDKFVNVTVRMLRQTSSSRFAVLPLLKVHPSIVFGSFEDTNFDYLGSKNFQGHAYGQNSSGPRIFEDAVEDIHSKNQQDGDSIVTEGPSSNSSHDPLLRCSSDAGSGHDQPVGAAAAATANSPTAASAPVPTHTAAPAQEQPSTTNSTIGTFDIL